MESKVSIVIWKNQNIPSKSSYSKATTLDQPLLIHMSVNEAMCGGFIAQYEEGCKIEHAIYYTSKTFV